MNPFERIQALSKVEAAPAAPFEERAAPPAPAPTPFSSPVSDGLAAAAAQASASPFAPFNITGSQPPVPPSEPPAVAAFTPLAPVPPAVTPTPPPAAPTPAAVFAPAPELRPVIHSPNQPVERVSLSLASVLKGCKTQDIGMSPDHIPSWVRVNLPLDLIRPQLLSGKVTVRVTQVMAALEPELRNLITPSHPDLSVDLPMSDLRKALPNEPFPEPVAKAPEAAPQPPAPLFHVFSPPPKTGAPDLVFGTPTTPPPVPPFFQTSPPPAELHISPSAADNSAWPLQPGTPEPELAHTAEPAELASAFSFLKEEPELAPASAEDDTVIDITPVTEEPVQSAVEATPPQAHEPAPVPTPPAPQPASEPTGITKAAIRVINPAPASQSASQMILRALLNTDEPLDAPAVMQLMACQPGIVAVVCLRDGLCLASAGNGGAEAEHFLNQAPKLYHHVKPLIELTGAQDTETFSMNSGPFVITFSLQGEVTLGVLHDPRTQGPALRERVILIARELTPLLAAPAA